MKPKYLNDKDPWMLGERIPDSDIFFFQIVFSSFTNDRRYSFLKSYRKVLATYEKFEMNFYFGGRDSYRVAESILRALIDRPRFGDKVTRNIIRWSNALIRFAKRTSRLPLRKYTNRQLWGLYEAHDRLHTKLYTYGWLPVSVDMFHNNMTNELKKRLRRVCPSDEAVNDAFVLLTTPTKKTVIAKEREEFLGIYRDAKRYLLKKKTPTAVALPLQLRKRLERHRRRWGHLGYIYAGTAEPFSASHYIEEMTDLARTGIDAAALLRKEEQRLQTAGRQQAAFYKATKLTSADRQLFATARDFALTKLFRRHAQLLDLYLLHRSLIEEIARRLLLTRYQVQFMLKDEVKTALFEGKVRDEVLSERLKRCVYYTELGFETVYIGARVRALVKKVARVGEDEVNELRGQTAQPGRTTGAVRIIIRAKDIARMNRGDILVSIATDPDIVPAMKRAGAIVTDQGGITSHAAIVSRELGIPCVIGTKIATQVFKDGDLVEVDATVGVVRRVRK